MDDPATSSQSPPGSADARRRSARAIASGFTASLAGIAINLWAADPVRAEAMASSLYGLPPHGGVPAAYLRFDREPPPLPRRDPDTTYPDMTIWRHGTQMVMSHSSGVTAAIGPGEARLGGYGDLEGGFRRSFPFILTELLLAHDLIVLHAGALLTPAGAVLAFGPTGSGKSTLIAAALTHARAALSDDLVVVKNRPVLSVTGVPKPPAIPSDVASDGTPGSDPRRRVLRPIDVLVAGWHSLVGSLRVSHGTTGELAPMKGGEVLTTAVGAFLGSIHPPALRQAFPVLAGAARLPAWDLQHTADPRSRLANAARLLSDVDHLLGPGR